MNGSAKAAQPAPKTPAPLTKESARALLDQALAVFKQPANKEELLRLVGECDSAPKEQAGMMKMAKLLPAVQKMLTPLLEEAGFGSDESNLMTVAMQIQAFGGEDPTIFEDTAKLMKAMQGDVSDLL